MTATIDLLSTNLHGVFGNRDQVSRRAAIESAYTDDVTFEDPGETVVGWDAIEQKAAKLLAEAPEDFVFAESGPTYVAGDTAALGWVFGPADNPVVRGIDIITVRDGRISRLKTLLQA